MKIPAPILCFYAVLLFEPLAASSQSSPLPAASQTAATQPAWCAQSPNPKWKALRRIPLSGTWFEVYEAAPHVFAIYEPRQSEATIGYLIVGSNRAALFDTGMGIGDLKKLTVQLTSLPIVVLNSHTHQDHVGNNWQFPTVYGMDTAFTRNNAKGSSAAAQKEIAPGEVCGDFPAGFDAKTYATRPWTITKYIHDGEVIDLGGRSLEVIATPGHTPDAICLFDKANGLLFTGDTYYPGTIWLFAPETDLAAYAASVHRLALLAPHVKQVLGAHNFPLTAPSILTALAADFDQVRAGKIAAVPAGEGKVVYKGSQVSFLLRAKD
jgi:glyoxylase-like metal-dependent hydrolase (beta-lactamase superfamily II)